MGRSDPRQVTFGDHAIDGFLADAKVLRPAGAPNPLTKIVRRVASTHAQAHGDAGEQLVARYAQRALENHVAWLWQVPTKTRGKPGKLRWVARSTVDFLGCLLDDSARMVAIEVKTTCDHRLDLPRVAPHQRGDLELLGAVNVLALIVAVFAEADGPRLRDPRVYVVEWARISSRTSVSERELRLAKCATDPEHFLLTYATSA